MSEWRRLAVYCSGCATWRDRIPHHGCARDAGNSALALDPDEFLLTCDACGEVWLIADAEATCPACDHVQLIEMRDDVEPLQPGDRLLAADGPVVYVLRGSGALLITHRGCISTDR